MFYTEILTRKVELWIFFSLYSFHLWKNATMQYNFSRPNVSVEITTYLSLLWTVLGAPGSGKGTISNWIVRDFGLKHVSSGDILRQHIKEGTDLGREAKSFIDKGALVPDEVMVNLISSELKKLESEPWLLDGK